MRTDDEIKALHDSPDIISILKQTRLPRIGHLERTDEEKTTKEIYKGIPYGRRSVGVSRKRRIDDVEDHLKKSNARNRKTKSKNRKQWKDVLRET